MSDSVVTPASRLENIADSLHLRLFTVDHLTIAAGKWNTPNVRSAFWRFYRNEDDGAFLDLPDRECCRLHKGRVYFVPAGVRFSCNNPAAAFRHFYVHFDVIGLPRLTMHTLFSGPVALPMNTDFEARVGAFAQGIAGGEMTLGQQCAAKSLLYEGFARHLETLTNTEREAGLRRAVELEPVAPAIQHIEACLADPLNISSLAALCCFSPDYFARRFKECVGQTPLAYITEQRITRAAQQLLFTANSLETIAVTCGFTNRDYLTRIFTRTVGVPPAAYRKNNNL